MLQNIKTLSVLVGLLAANVYGAQRMKDLSVGTPAVTIAGGSEWSLSNPDGQSLHEILARQRRGLLARRAVADSIVAPAFVGCGTDINAPVVLNFDQIALFRSESKTRITEIRLLACTVLNLVVEEATLVALCLSESDVRNIFINVNAIDIVPSPSSSYEGDAIDGCKGFTGVGELRGAQ
jgi:hypothetical protein